jgi:Fe-Mn family superoxide dismutase
MYIRQQLAYELSALEPFIDTKTMNEHYNVHYVKYMDNLNNELNLLDIQNDGSLSSLINILKSFDKYSLKIRNNGGGFLNHHIYFNNISPVNRNYEIYASDELKSRITNRFNSYENFVNNFSNAGAEVFGSGWVWLVDDGKKLRLLTTANQDNPLMSMDCNILLGMDVWEHAYYLKHMADRKAYIKYFFQTINWQNVSNNLK